MIRLCFLLVLVAAVVGAWWSWKPARNPGPGQIAPKTPLQMELPEPRRWERDGYRYEALFLFMAEARILGTKTYWFDASAKISPIDLALGWGPMSDTAVLKRLTITQSGRWYEYRWGGEVPPLPEEAIPLFSANMHMIPADADVRRVLLAARRGEVIQLQGVLVAVSGPDGFTWRSSTSRVDSGGGSCEVIWVEKARLLHDGKVLLFSHADENF